MGKREHLAVPPMYTSIQDYTPRVPRYDEFTPMVAKRPEEPPVAPPEKSEHRVVVLCALFWLLGFAQAHAVPIAVLLSLLPWE